MTDDILFDELMELVGADLGDEIDDEIFANPRFAAWLVADSWGAMTGVQQASLNARVQRASRRMLANDRAKRLAARIPTRDLLYRAAPVTARAREAQRLAKIDRCTPLFEVPVAAGAGRDLLDEECDTWVELPKGFPSGNYVALRVKGDSMVPFINSGDLILVELGTAAIAEDVVVARDRDDGYVVKIIDRITPSDVQLHSLNVEYEPISVPNDSRHVLGKVVARLYRA
jgi:phage repressor protein C with HTH and peptisase S24 domain